MAFDADDLEQELVKLQKSKKSKEPKKKQKVKMQRFDLEAEVERLPGQSATSSSAKRGPSVALGQWLDSAERASRISDITEVGRRLKLPEGVSIAENVLMAFYEPRERKRTKTEMPNEGWGSRIRALLLLGQDIGSPVWMKGGLKQWAKLRDAFDEAGLLPPQRKYQMVGSPWLDVPDLDVQAASKELVKRVREWEDEQKSFHVPVETMRRLAADVIEVFSK